MSETKTRPYHHGDLRRAAIEAALEHLKSDGAKISLRRVADDVGVTHRALYRYFENRDALLSALAAAGFRQFADTIEQAPRTASAFVAAYVRFALEHQALYDLMMKRPAEGRSDELKGLHSRIITSMRAAFKTDDAAKRAWMILHGGITLHRGGMLQARNPDALTGFLKDMIP